MHTSKKIIIFLFLFCIFFIKVTDSHAIDVKSFSTVELDHRKGETDDEGENSEIEKAFSFKAEQPIFVDQEENYILYLWKNLCCVLFCCK